MNQDSRTKGVSRREAAALMGLTMLGLGSSADAQEWPSRAIRIIVPYAPGGIADLVARLIQPGLQESLRQPVVIENKAGASGSLGTEFVARAQPDGYTLLLALAAPQTLNQSIYKVGYDGVKDFAPITLINTNPLVLMAHPDLPVRNVQELIAYAKARPGVLNFAGAGGLTQFSGEIMKHMAGIEMVHVPYRGGAPAVAAAAAGDVQLTFANYSDALTWMKSGRLRPLAITSSKRFAQSPELPTMAESGLPGYEVTGWSGILAPAGTPAAIIDRLAGVLRPLLTSAEMKKRMDAIGAEPGGTSPAEFGQQIAAETVKWADFVQRTGIKVGQ
jgi:tripartite-type tricarboxylate transporter receptor subunit TctC